MELYELRHVVNLALDVIAGDASFLEAEVCASWCEQQIAELSHDTAQPENAGPSLRDETACGFSILLVMADGAGRKVGFGVDRDDLTRDSIALALEIAKQSAVVDPGFTSLPKPPEAIPTAPMLHDPAVMSLSDDAVAGLASEALDGALSTFREAAVEAPFRISGEVRSRTELLVVGNSHGLLAEDTSTALLATLHGYLGSQQSHGVGSHSATHLKDFSPHDAGVEAATEALRARDGTALPAGEYAVIFGPRAVADLCQDILLPALSLDTLANGISPFEGRFGQQIASTFLTVADEGRFPGLVGSRSITGDGLPTGSTTLIAGGRLTGFLADVYHTQAMAPKFGPLPPYNGMRHAMYGESYAMRPGIFPTNVIFASDTAVPRDALVAPITNGIYVGGLWATAFRRGAAPGDFISTIVGPSFHIHEGKFAQPLQPRVLHIQDNVLDVLQRLTGLSTLRRPVVLTSGQSVVLAPELRCSRVSFVQRRG